jgi:NAD(P)-dependent dehydrogenase (short-subunit alcohol dehydrogenase family)
MKIKWNATDMPNLEGQTAVVTGASSGIGYEIALQLAAHRAHVVLASRNQGRTEQAARRIKTILPEASVEAQVLDLADLVSVCRFAETFSKRHQGLDILVNNAGIAGGPRRQTPDGFEMHFQVNYLGHFALTGLLLPSLCSRAGSRVVTTSSDIASQGKIDFDDLQAEHTYRWITAYAQSKLANLLFAFELDRRCQAVSAGMSSFATHPGVARTNLLTGKEAEWGRPRQGTESLIRVLQIVLAHPAVQAALPALYQATDPSARSAEYIGPSKGIGGGYLVASKVPPAALDQVTAQRLWDVSEELTGVQYDLLDQAGGKKSGNGGALEIPS